MRSAIEKQKGNSNGKIKYYLMLVSVVIIWGLVPSIKNELLTTHNYPPEIMTSISAVIAFLAILIICIRHLKKLNLEYLKIAVVTGIFYSAACVMQNEGLKYTSSAMYSFLENLSCLVVPFLVWWLTKNRPSIFKFIGAIFCLASLFVLCFRNGFGSFGFGIGEILCGLAGLFYGVNIAVTGVKAKKLDPRLYLLVQFGVHAIVSCIYAVISTIIKSQTQEIIFSFDITSILILVGMVLISTVLGWLIRTICLTHLAPSFVAIVMPFASIITAIMAVIMGEESLTSGLIIGAILGVLAAILSDLDINRMKRKYRYAQYRRSKLKKSNTSSPLEQNTEQNEKTPTQMD